VTTAERLDLLFEQRGDVVVLLAPGVGYLTGALEKGALVAPGGRAGALLVLGRAFELVVPDGVEGRVVTAPPVRTRQPVGWGEAIYEVQTLADDATGRADDRAAGGSTHRTTGPGEAAGSGALVVRATQSGRFYLRGSPGEEPFAAVGAIVENGQPIGLIEVMKTFAHVRYGGAGLPPRARVAAVLVEDGAEVAAGDPLLRVERA
jgi:acetyl-CoA carboxylase biotin carboxyl carrier protein